MGNNVILDLMSQLRGTDASVPVAAPPYPSHPITEQLQAAHGVSARALGEAGRERVQRQDGNDIRPERAEQLGGNGPQAAHHGRPGAAGARQGRHAGTGLARGCGVGAGRRSAAAARAR